ncbi:hypothetical protein SALBM311S_04204 [Streptomyces alboniger]
MASAIRYRILPRSAARIRAHSGAVKAALAAATAWSTSALPASATWAMAVPFDGSRTVKERPSVVELLAVDQQLGQLRFAAHGWISPSTSPKMTTSSPGRTVRIRRRAIRHSRSASSIAVGCAEPVHSGL